MAKATAQPALAPCRIFVIRGGPDVGDWTDWIRGELRARGNLTSKLADAEVVLVVAGQFFFTRGDKNARRSIKQAFQHGKPVVPVLVNDAGMEVPDLPADIRAFAYQQAVTLSSKRAIPGMLARVIAAHRVPVGQLRSAGQPSSKGAIPGAPVRASVAHRIPIGQLRNGGPPLRLGTKWGMPQIIQPTEPSVFVCYRRDDSGYWADALARSLASRIGGDRVFFDIGSEQPGRDYRQQINDALDRCTIFVVVIGPGFLERSAGKGRRLDDKRDQVRKEIRLALNKMKPLHVVLTGGTKLPVRADLPDEIAEMANAVMVSRLRSESNANAIVKEIVSGRHQKGRPNVLADLWQEQQNLEKAIESVVAKLADFGWNVVSEQYDLGRNYTLGHSQHPGFRLEVQAKKAEVVLQEHIKSARRLGFRRWVTRSVFSISPRTYSTVDMLQLPEDLLKAAMDPGRYLDRIGRFDLAKFERRKLMSQHDFLGNVKTMRNSNPAAIEAYQKTRRHAHARGGLKRLEFQGSVLDSPEGPHANSAAFTGAEDSLAVVCDGSLHLVDTRGHRFGDPVPVDGACRCVSRSRQGRLAIGSDEGRIWIWDADGTPVETAMTPYSTLRRARIRLAGEGIAITTVSWSDKGNVLACCGTNEVWIYHVATRQMTRWPFPEHLGFDMYYGAHFVPGRNEFLVFGRSRYLWVVELPTLEIRTALELKRRPGRLGLSREYGSAAEPPAGPVFTDIYAASPSPLGDLVACAGSHGQVAVYDLESMVQVKTFAWHEPFKNGMSNQVLAVSFSPDGQWLASVARDGQLVVGNTRGWEAERTANVVDFTSGDSIDWSPDSTTIAETASGLVGLWRM